MYSLENTTVQLHIYLCLVFSGIIAPGRTPLRAAAVRFMSDSESSSAFASTPGYVLNASGTVVCRTVHTKMWLVSSADRRGAACSQAWDTSGTSLGHRRVRLSARRLGPACTVRVDGLYSKEFRRISEDVFAGEPLGSASRDFSVLRSR